MTPSSCPEEGASSVVLSPMRPCFFDNPFGMTSLIACRRSNNDGQQRLPSSRSRHLASRRQGTVVTLLRDPPKNLHDAHPTNQPGSTVFPMPHPNGARRRLAGRYIGRRRSAGSQGTVISNMAVAAAKDGQRAIKRGTGLAGKTQPRSESF